MSVDLAALIRRHKPHKKLAQLSARGQEELHSFQELRVRSDTGLLLDTGVYIAEAAGELTSEQAEKLARIKLHHCTVCLGEITVGLANRDVSAGTWPKECEYWEGLFKRLPRTRTHAPDAQIWAAAGILSGTLTRLQKFQPHQRKDALNDALIYLTGIRQGIPVLTRNPTDFDFLQQLLPDGRFYVI